MKKLRVLQILILLIATFGISLSSIYAIEYFSLGGRPVNPDSKVPNSSAWFIYNLNPGERKEDALEAINNHATATEIMIYAADGIKSSGGGFAIKQYVEERKEVGSWIRFFPNEVPSVFKSLFKANNNSIIQFCNLELDSKWKNEDKEAFTKWCAGEETVQIKVKAKSTRIVKFVFSVPKDAEVGEHTGGILIQKVEPEKSAENGGITLTTRVGIRVYETVPGVIVKDLVIKEFKIAKLFEELDFKKMFSKDKKPEEFMITTRIENKGNVSVDFSESILITDDLFNKSEERVTDRKFQVQREDIYTSNYTWRNPRFGKFSFVNNITYADGKNEAKLLTTDKVTIWMVPWREIIIASIIMFVTITPTVIVRKIRKKKFSGNGWDEYIVQHGDTLDTISLKFNISWKHFAKTNKIKPPYTLKAGQKVLVPPRKR